MARRIGFLQERLGTMVPCTLLDELAPRSTEFLWALAGTGAQFAVNHAIWTGPEMSMPLPAPGLPPGAVCKPVPPENASAFPRAGDVVLSFLPAGSTRGLPPGDFFDIGIFYDEGGRLLMPFGWIQANITARIAPEDLPLAQAMARDLRGHGGCLFRLQQL